MIELTFCHHFGVETSSCSHVCSEVCRVEGLEAFVSQEPLLIAPKVWKSLSLKFISKKNSSSCFQLFPQKTSSNEYNYVKKNSIWGQIWGGKILAPMSKTLPILGVVLGQILSQSFPRSPNPSPTNISTK